MTASTHPADDDINHSLNQSLIALCADPEFQQLDAELKVFNPFRVLKVERYELMHTTTLAWLLNPHESHGMGDVFLQCFLRQVAPTNTFWNSAETTSADVRTELVFNQRGTDLRPSSDDAVDIVARPGDRLDVLIEGRNANRGAKWCVAIEAKIDSKEGEKQLARYDQWLTHRFGEHQLLKLYLTVASVGGVDADVEDGVAARKALTPAPSSAHWKNILWGEQVANALDQCRKQLADANTTLGPAVATFIDHYRQLLSALSNKKNTDFDHKTHAFANRPDVSVALRALAQRKTRDQAPGQHWDAERCLPAYWRHRTLLDRCTATLRSAKAEFVWEYALKGLSQNKDWHILTSLTSTDSAVAFVPQSWVDAKLLQDSNNEWSMYYHAAFREANGDVELKLLVPNIGNHAAQLERIRLLFPEENLTLGPPCLRPDPNALGQFFRSEIASMKLHTVSLPWRSRSDGSYEPDDGRKPLDDEKFARFWVDAQLQSDAILKLAQAHPAQFSKTMSDQ